MNGKGSRSGSHRVNLISVTPAYSGDASDHSNPATRETFPILQIDKGNRQVSLAGRQLNLTRLEFDLLAELAAHPNVVFTRERLLERVWGYQSGVGGKTVDVHVANLRRKLGKDLPIVAVRGVGYRLDPSVA